MTSILNTETWPSLGPCFEVVFVCQITNDLHPYTSSSIVTDACKSGKGGELIDSPDTYGENRVRKRPAPQTTDGTSHRMVYEIRAAVAIFAVQRDIYTIDRSVPYWYWACKHLKRGHGAHKAYGASVAYGVLYLKSVTWSQLFFGGKVFLRFSAVGVITLIWFAWRGFALRIEIDRVFSSLPPST